MTQLQLRVGDMMHVIPVEDVRVAVDIDEQTLDNDVRKLLMDDDS